MFWFFCSNASKLKITFSLCVTPDRRRYHRFLHLSNDATCSSKALFVMALYSSCWFIRSKFSIDSSKANFSWMFKNSMQQRLNSMQQQLNSANIAILRLAKFTLTPAKIHACVTHAPWDHKYISILLLKRKHSYQFASGIKPFSLSARVFSANESGSSLSYSVAA